MYTAEHLPRECSTPRQPGVKHPRHQGGNRGRRLFGPQAVANPPATWRLRQATAQLRKCDCRMEPQRAQVGGFAGAHQMAQHPSCPSHCGARALQAPWEIARSSNPGLLLGASAATPMLFRTLTRSGWIVCVSTCPNRTSLGNGCQLNSSTKSCQPCNINHLTFLNAHSSLVSNSPKKFPIVPKSMHVGNLHSFAYVHRNRQS